MADTSGPAFQGEFPAGSGHWGVTRCILPRPVQRNCQQEPPFPGADTVVASLRYPELTSHLAHPECPHEGPHPVAECWRWRA